MSNGVLEEAVKKREADLIVHDGTIECEHEELGESELATVARELDEELLETLLLLLAKRG